MSTASQVSKLYHTVVEDVISNVKDAFLDEGVDEQVLMELKQLWEQKLSASKALEGPPASDQDIIIPAPHMTIMPPQPIQTKTQEQGVLVQGTQIQGATQFQLTPAAATATFALPGLLQHQLAALGSGGQIQNITVQQTGNGQYITLSGIPSQQLPQLQQQRLQQPQLAQHIAPHMLQQQLRSPQQQIRLAQSQPANVLSAGLLQQNPVSITSQVKAQGAMHQNVIQTDGTADTSSSEDDDFDDDDKEDEDKDDENEEEEQGEEEDPLNSADDVSEEDPTELFDTENVVVCQYDKINRNKNKWKFHLKDGIMNLNGRDFVFQKANGDSEW